MSDRILLTPCPPPDYKNPYVKAHGNIETLEIEYFMTKEYAAELYSNPAFRTSQAAVGNLLFERLKELVIQCYCPFILQVGNAATQMPILAYNLLNSIKYEGAWKVHYHLVLEVRELIHTYMFYYDLEYRDPKNPTAPPFRPKKPVTEKPKEIEDPRMIQDEPNEKNLYKLSDRKLSWAMDMFNNEIREEYPHLKGIEKARTIVNRSKEFFKEETEENKNWLQMRGFL